MITGVEMKTQANRNKFSSERGTAMIETLPILVIFIMLFGYSIGLFGVVHTAILNSISSRTYAIETLSNRSDVTLFRDRRGVDGLTHYAGYGTRFHTIDPEQAASALARQGTQYATTRPLDFSRRAPASTVGSVLDHNFNIYQIVGRNRQGMVEASPAWVMVGYGMCITAKCGD